MPHKRDGTPFNSELVQKYREEMDEELRRRRDQDRLAALVFAWIVVAMCVVMLYWSLVGRYTY